MRTKQTQTTKSPRTTSALLKITAVLAANH